jgi:hypothetical protein
MAQTSTNALRLIHLANMFDEAVRTGKSRDRNYIIWESKRIYRSGDPVVGPWAGALFTEAMRRFGGVYEAPTEPIFALLTLSDSSGIVDSEGWCA